MILKITRQYDKSFDNDVYKLSTEMLNIKSTHLFIASNPWDEISIELDDVIQPNYLHCVSMACDNIKVSLPEKVTSSTVQQLTELYPDKAGTIRKTYMQSGDLKGVLQGCLV